MEIIPAPINHWKHYHDSLADDIAKAHKARIEYVLGISQSAFYRKLRHPHKFLSIAEKEAIAKVYGLKAVYLFPELEERFANVQIGKV
jgi:BetR domain